MNEFFQLTVVLKKNIHLYFSEMEFYNQNTASENIIFANMDGKVLKGDYLFLVNIYSVDKKVNVTDSNLILGGKAY